MKHSLARHLTRLALGLCAATLCWGCAPKPQKPNILYIMSDDHTSNGIGAYGGRFKDLGITPTIDQLASEGVIFTQNFCNNSICAPSRATVLTGQYSVKNGVLDLAGGLEEARQYLPLELRKAGYQTAIVGKWHLKHDPSGFEYFQVLPNQGDYQNPTLYSNDTTIGPARELDFKYGIKREVHAKKYEGHSTDVITDIALEWFGKRRKKDQPFFLALQYKAPHDMFDYAHRYESYMADVEFPEPDNMWDQGDWGSVGTRGAHDSLRSVIGSSIGKRNVIRNMGMHMDIDPSLPDSVYKHEAYQEYMRRYFRCVKGIDDNLKRVFAYLEEEGLMDNTVIVYTADQGFYLGEHDFIDKRWMYDEAMRMPLIMRYPKEIPAGTQCDWLTNNTDYAPTLLDFAGIETPDYMQGRSFRGGLDGSAQPSDWREVTYYRYYMHMAHKHNNPAHVGIRNKQYKLILYYGTDFQKRDRPKKDGNRFWDDTPVSWEFYDLERDPGENINLYDDPAYADIIADLKEKLYAERERIGDTDLEFPEAMARIEGAK
ncbi:sulfatase [Pontibacter sp. G13]|uniref:sulfatase family protein n=1 Tax=Pontibacter sp. G13 TaxID=3074898 RepID=UPI00288A2BEF|nr:sulfatase [Pontibacter sp. G13]WNJ16995.1 sulfatase [Pontibacter sp. G13]